MARYIGPRARVNRRFGASVFVPGNAEERKPYIPGMHGPRLHRKVSDYSLGLVEKQKVRYMYGLTEKQFRLYFKKAKSKRDVTDTAFLRLLELWLTMLYIVWVFPIVGQLPDSLSRMGTFVSMAKRSIYLVIFARLVMLLKFRASLFLGKWLSVVSN
jgi:hypothetical protein